MDRIIYVKLKSQSMIEVIIALVVVMVVFTIGMMIFINVTSSIYSLQRLNAQLLLQEFSLDTKIKQTFFDETIQKGNITIEKKVMEYRKINNLVFVVYTATDQTDIILAERRELINTETSD